MNENDDKQKKYNNTLCVYNIICLETVCLPHQNSLHILCYEKRSNADTNKESKQNEMMFNHILHTRCYTAQHAWK